MSWLLAIAALTAPVALTVPPPVARGVAAFPRIARPASDAERRINAALARLDARVRVAVRACGVETVNPTSWTRSIDATMRGPAFVSYLVTDEVDCGGAYPSDSHAAIVFDLASGAPVDWRALLSTRLTGTQALNEGPDGVRVVTLSSSRLRALYAARYDAAARASGAPAECLGSTAADGFARPMIAWLDARRGALALRFDLNHAMQACSIAVTIPAAILQREGASVRLVDALRGAGR